ncbi:unnamed protein product [Rotaria sp. Silwood2]|nr:unnamed protein product [Rotaria sp. Silwood2]CAF3094349.1 unnamed protein product [Rotaria sp. Silwood2]CAF3971377.1 unnamed protein product [Rotaria sp. Silwood2]CAF4120058.1 unnamed protein product [Rotaria sp. Silwood2]
MPSFYLFIIISLLLCFFQSINSESENLLISTTTLKFNLYDNVTITTSTIDNKTDQTSISTSTYFNTTTTFIINTRINSSNITINTNEIKITTTLPSSTTESTTSDVSNNHSKQSSSRSKWWLLIALIVMTVVLISIAFIYYQRRQTPYTRFLRNWQPRDDDADNTILQLEQSDIINNQWPHQISLV